MAETGAPRPGPAGLGWTRHRRARSSGIPRHRQPPWAAPSSAPGPRLGPAERAGREGTGEAETQGRKTPPPGPRSASAGGDRTATGIFNLTLARGPRLRLICHPRPVTVMHFAHCRGRARGEPSGTGRAGWGAGAVCPGGGGEQKL